MPAVALVEPEKLMALGGGGVSHVGMCWVLGGVYGEQGCVGSNAW